MILRYSEPRNVFYIRPQEMRHEDIPAVQAAGFEWYDHAGAWLSMTPFQAMTLWEHADLGAAQILQPYMFNLESSMALSTTASIPAPDGCEYMPFQGAGVEITSYNFGRGARSQLIADPMGLGKTVQGAGVINYMDLDPFKSLVIGPASLRVNWQRELDKWLVEDRPAMPILRGDIIPRARAGPLVISYNLLLNPLWLEYIMWHEWEIVIFDEAHYLKSPDALRTVACLQSVCSKAKHTLFLSGTPIPNRPHEFFSYLNAVAPGVIDGMTEKQFTNRYTTGFMGGFGWQITGGRNHRELYNRLRGSGWMLRRDKRTVLPQLPPERYNMVVFPQNRRTAEVIEKEKPFDAQEILKAGKPLGYASLPELRREMGVEKLPDCIEWIKDAMEGGCDKLVVFAFHQEVLEGLTESLKKYKPILIYGPTAQGGRQALVDRFQTDPECRLAIGGWQPMGTGWTLTAAADVAFVEASYVPGDNDQMKDRCVRIGQEAEGVNIWFLVVEGSLDASILSKAANKAHDIGQVLDGE